VRLPIPIGDSSTVALSMRGAQYPVSKLLWRVTRVAGSNLVSSRPPNVTSPSFLPSARRESLNEVIASEIRPAKASDSTGVGPFITERPCWRHKCQEKHLGAVMVRRTDRLKPMIPSKGLELEEKSLLSTVATPNFCFGKLRPATIILSVTTLPLIVPWPYEMLNASLVFTNELETFGPKKLWFP